MRKIFLGFLAVGIFLFGSVVKADELAVNLPKFAIQKISALPLNMATNDSVAVDFTLHNIGKAPATTVLIQLQVDKKNIQSDYQHNLPPNSYLDSGLNWEIPANSLTEGKHLLGICTTPESGGKILATDCVERHIYIRAQNKAKLVLENITYSPALPDITNEIIVKAKVTNVGTYIAKPNIIQLNTNGAEEVQTGLANMKKLPAINPNKSAEITWKLPAYTFNAGMHKIAVCLDAANEVNNDTDKCFTDSFYVSFPPKADLAIEKLEAKPATPIDTKDFTVALTIKNKTKGPAINFNTEFSVTKEATDENNIAYGPLYGSVMAVGMEKPIKSTWNIPANKLSPGEYGLHVCVNTDKKVEEENYNNNCITVPFTIAAGPKSDLSMANLYFDPSSIVVGQNFKIVARVKNVGKLKTSASFVTAKADMQKDGSFNITLPTMTLKALWVNQSQQLIWKLNSELFGVGEYPIQLCVNKNEKIFETNMDNNCQTKTLTIHPKITAVEKLPTLNLLPETSPSPTAPASGAEQESTTSSSNSNQIMDNLQSNLSTPYYSTNNTAVVTNTRIIAPETPTTRTTTTTTTRVTTTTTRTTR